MAKSSSARIDALVESYRTYLNGESYASHQAQIARKAIAIATAPGSEGGVAIGADEALSLDTLAAQSVWGVRDLVHRAIAVRGSSPDLRSVFRLPRPQCSGLTPRRTP